MRTSIFLTGLLLALAASLYAAPKAGAQTWPDLVRPAEKVGGGAGDAAVIVGVEDYLLVSDVPGAADNALAWTHYLNKTRGVKLGRISLLQNHEATRENVEAALEKAAKDVLPGGTLWFIFIGHGAASPDGEDGVLIGADAQNTPASIYARSLSKERALRLLGAGKQAHTVAVLDTCFSGKTNGGEDVAPGLQPLIPVKEQGSHDERLTLFTAGTSSQFAGPLPGAGRPAFSYLLLGALRGWGDENGDGEVSAQEASDYTLDTLRFLLSGKRAQTPQLVSRHPERVMVASDKLERGPDVLSLGRGPGPALEKFAEEEVVTFDSTPRGAAVLVDGKLLCQQTPCSRSLPLGRHQVEMSGDCVQPGTQSFVVQRGDAVDVSLQLQARQTQITIRAQDSKGNALKARVSVDGQEVGYTPGRFGVGVCSNVVEVSQKGYRSWSSPLQLKKGQALSLNASLVAEVSDAVADFNCPSGMVGVPGGKFKRGSTSRSNEQPVREISVSSFCIDKTEVTAGAYEDCVRGGGCTAAKTGGTCTYDVSGKRAHPINCVDWNQAVAYCKWAGKRLPTEAEWEKAARGTDSRTYPWGEDEPDCNYAVVYDGGYGCGRGETWPVGSKAAGASPYGALDMTGNVWEWVNDGYDPEYYADAPLSDPRGPLSGSFRAIRGGSWCSGGVDLRAASRFYGPPDADSADLGIRCARTP